MAATSPESWGGEGNLPDVTVYGGVVKRGVALAAYVVRDGGVKRVSGGEGCWLESSRGLFSLISLGGVDSGASFLDPSWVLAPVALESEYQSRLVVGMGAVVVDVGVPGVGVGIGVWVRGLLGYSASPPPVLGSRLRGRADEEVVAVA